MLQNTDISEKRFINFLEHLGQNSGVRAVGLALDALSIGKSLESLLSKKEDSFGYMLDVEKLSADRFKISFGCMAGPEAGDGGEWEVGYGDDDKVVTCEGGTSWMR